MARLWLPRRKSGLRAKSTTPSFPRRRSRYCLEQGGLSPDQLDYVGFYDKPFLKFERLLETYLGFAPVGFVSFLQAMPVWLKQKLHLRRELNRGLQHQYGKRYVSREHHESHAASAFFPSPFDEAAILTVDGVGEWATASYGVGQGNRISTDTRTAFPAFAGSVVFGLYLFLRLSVNSGEYKLMGLAPYGEPKYADLILERMIDLKDDGSFRMDMSYFNYCQGTDDDGPQIRIGCSVVLPASRKRRSPSAKWTWRLRSNK